MSEKKITDEKIDEVVFDRLAGDITKFAATLSPAERAELLKMSSWLFAKIYQAGAVAALDVLRELKELE